MRRPKTLLSLKKFLAGKSVLSIILYSSSYLPIIATWIRGGFELQGNYAILRSAFDLLVSIHILGFSQSFFELSRKIPYERIMWVHHIAALISSIGLVVAVYLTGAEIWYLVLIFSAYIYSIFAVRRLLILLNALPVLYQLINALFAFSLAIFISLGTAGSANKLALYILLSVLIQCSVTWWVLMSPKYSTTLSSSGLNVTETVELLSGLKVLSTIIKKSLLAFGYQAVQISFSFVVVQFMRKEGLSLTQIGYFSVAYSICSLIYAPATVFGSNIVAYLYEVGGVVDVKKVHIIARLVACITVVAFGLAVVEWWFKLIQPIKHSKIILVMAVLCPILASARLVVPVAIWIGDLGFLIICEIAKILIALILVVFWFNRSLEEVLSALFAAELFFSVGCFLYFVKIKKKIIACT